MMSRAIKGKKSRGILVILLLIFSFFITSVNILLPTVDATPVLIDSYSESNQDDQFYIKDLHPDDEGLTSAHGPSFWNNDTVRKITSAKFYLRKTGSPTGNAHAILYTHSETYGVNSTPTGVPLATSDDFDVSTLTVSLALITLTFNSSQQYEMSADTTYIIVFEGPQSGLINETNYIHFGVDGSSPSHDGNIVTFYNGAWSTSSAYDGCFYVYGEAAGVEHCIPAITGLSPEWYNASQFTLTVATSGGENDTIWYNVLNESVAVYGINQTYTTPVMLTGYTYGLNYTIIVYANNTDGVENSTSLRIALDPDGYKVEWVGHEDNGTWNAWEIQKCVDEADADGGGNVYFPIGNYSIKVNVTNLSFTNKNYTVKIQAGVNLIGSNWSPNTSRRTIIFFNETDVDTNRREMFLIDGRNDKSIIIKGFYFQSWAANLTDDNLASGGITLCGVRDYRISECFFIDFYGTAIFADGNYAEKWNRGVIWNCTVDNPYKDTYWNNTGVYPYWAYGFYNNGNEEWINETDEVLGMFHNNTMIVEDCVIRRTRHGTDSGPAAEGIIVSRYTTYEEMIVDFYGAYVNLHGGARAMEAYNITINNYPCDYRSDPDPGDWGKYRGIGMNPRGGAGVAFNNTFNLFDWGTAIKLSNDQGINEKWRLDQWWIWDNTYNDVLTELDTAPGVWTIDENDEYFLYAKDDYTPYPYPHPLRTGDSFYILITKNTTVAGNPVEIEAQWYDLDYPVVASITETNSSGSLTNYTSSFVGNVSTTTFTLNSTVGNRIRYRQHVNNTNGELVTSPWFYLTTTGDGPPSGWKGIIMGVTNPAKILGVLVENIYRLK